MFFRPSLMISSEQRSVVFSLNDLTAPRGDSFALPFPVFTDTAPDGKRGFVQFWPERDCARSLEFFRAIDPAAHARWWTREVISRTGARGEYPKDLPLGADVELSVSHPAFRKKVLDALGVGPAPEYRGIATRGCGYEEDGATGTIVRVSPLASEYASSGSLGERIGESRELLPDIPELYDPEIYFEHTPTQSPFASAERLRAEGEQDAWCARHYLSAYRRFMEAPSVGSLLDATEDPKFGDSYYLAMKWCLKNRVSEDFISLLHVTFAVQWVLQSRPYGSTPSPTGSRGLFREDVELLAGVVRRYCQGEG